MNLETIIDIQNKVWFQKYRYLIFFFFLLGFYLISAPENRTESDDGYWYAFEIRHSNFDKLYFSSYLLFLPFFKTVYISIKELGFDADAFSLMSIINCIFSALTVLLLYRYFRIHFRFSKSISLLGTVLFAISYGFWRYASEAEIYGLSQFIIILVLLLVEILPRNKFLPYLLTISLIGSIGVLFYKPNVVPLFMALPFAFLLKRDYKMMLAYGMTGIVMVLGVYYITYLSIRSPTDNFSSHVMGVSGKRDLTNLSIIPVIAANQVASNWVYSFEPVTNRIANTFKHKAIDEERFLGAYHKSYRYVAFSIFLLLIVATAINFFFAIKYFISSDRKKISTPIIWIGLYAIIVSFLDPTSSEPWLMIQIPLALIVTNWIIRPIVLAGKTRYPVVLILLLFLINLIGGMMMVSDKESDLYNVKSSWLIENVKNKDVILTVGPMSYVRYLRYFSGQTVYNLEQGIDQDLRNILENELNERDVFITDDAFNIPKAIAFRSPATVKEIELFLGQIETTLVNQTDNFKTYKVLAN